MELRPLRGRDMAGIVPAVRGQQPCSQYVAGAYLNQTLSSDRTLAAAAGATGRIVVFVGSIPHLPALLSPRHALRSWRDGAEPGGDRCPQRGSRVRISDGLLAAHRGSVSPMFRDI